MLIAYNLASLVAQMVKNVPAKQETQVRSLGREDALEKEMAIGLSVYKIIHVQITIFLLPF